MTNETVPAQHGPIKTGQILIFLAIAFAFTWAVFGAVHMTGGLKGPAAGALIILAMFGPALGAVICARLFDKGRFWKATGLSVPRISRIFKWLPYAWLMPVLLAALAVIGVLIWQQTSAANPADAMAKMIVEVGGEEALDEMPFSLDVLVWIQLASLPIGMAINTLILTVSEELGWRGWLQPKLASLGFWKMSGLIGVIWGLWHAPLILMGYNYPGLGWGGVAAMCVFTLMLTPYLSLLRERGTGAWGAGAFHGSLNAVAGASFLFLPDATWPLSGLLGPAGFLIMLAGWPLIELYRRTRPVPKVAHAE